VLTGAFITHCSAYSGFRQ